VRSTTCFEQRHGVRGIGLVALHVSPHVVCRQQPHLDPARAQQSSPVMRAATRFHDDEFHISIDEPALELTTRQATALDYPPGFVAHRKLENVLSHVHRHGCSIHLGLLLSFMLKPPKASAGTMMPNKTREESIPSIERTASSKKLASRRRSCRTFGEERGR